MPQLFSGGGTFLFLLDGAAIGIRLPLISLIGPDDDDEELHAADPNSAAANRAVTTIRAIAESPVDDDSDYGGEAASPPARVDKAEMSGMSPVGVGTFASPAEYATNRHEPSPNRKLAPPECKLQKWN